MSDSEGLILLIWVLAIVGLGLMAAFVAIADEAGR